MAVNAGAMMSMAGAPTADNTNWGGFDDHQQQVGPPANTAKNTNNAVDNGGRIMDQHQHNQHNNERMSFGANELLMENPDGSSRSLNYLMDKSKIMSSNTFSFRNGNASASAASGQQPTTTTTTTTNSSSGNNADGSSRRFSFAGGGGSGINGGMSSNYMAGGNSNNMSFNTFNGNNFSVGGTAVDGGDSSSNNNNTIDNHSSISSSGVGVDRRPSLVGSNTNRLPPTSEDHE